MVGVYVGVDKNFDETSRVLLSKESPLIKATSLEESEALFLGDKELPQVVYRLDMNTKIKRDYHGGLRSEQLVSYVCSQLNFHNLSELFTFTQKGRSIEDIGTSLRRILTYLEHVKIPNYVLVRCNEPLDITYFAGMNPQNLKKIRGSAK